MKDTICIEGTLHRRNIRFHSHTTYISHMIQPTLNKNKTLFVKYVFVHCSKNKDIQGVYMPFLRVGIMMIIMMKIKKKKWISCGNACIHTFTTILYTGLTTVIVYTLVHATHSESNRKTMVSVYIGGNMLCDLQMSPVDIYMMWVLDLKWWIHVICERFG